MNRDEARPVLDRELARLRATPYGELRKRIPRRRWRFLGIEILTEDQDLTHEVTGPSGTVYQVETQVLWDGAADGDIRVMVSVDDGGASAFRPMTDSFIVASDGSFVGAP